MNDLELVRVAIFKLGETSRRLSKLASEAGGFDVRSRLSAASQELKRLETELRGVVGSESTESDLPGAA